MSRSLTSLRIANPCPATWEEMEGDARGRHCCECKLSVYNLSDMSAAEAEELLQRHEGRLCVRYFQRTDGRIMTRDCPRGVMAARMRLGSAILASAGVVVTIFGYLIQREMRNSEEATWFENAVARGRDVPLLEPVVNRIAPEPYVFIGSITGDPPPVVAPPGQDPFAPKNKLRRALPVARFQGKSGVV